MLLKACSHSLTSVALLSYSLRESSCDLVQTTRSMFILGGHFELACTRLKQKQTNKKTPLSWYKLSTLNIWGLWFAWEKWNYLFIYLMNVVASPGFLLTRLRIGPLAKSAFDSLASPTRKRFHFGGMKCLCKSSLALILFQDQQCWYFKMNSLFKGWLNYLMTNDVVISCPNNNADTWVCVWVCVHLSARAYVWCMFTCIVPERIYMCILSVCACVFTGVVYVYI